MERRKSLSVCVCVYSMFPKACGNKLLTAARSAVWQSGECTVLEALSTTRFERSAPAIQCSNARKPLLTTASSTPTVLQVYCTVLYTTRITLYKVQYTAQYCVRVPRRSAQLRAERLESASAVQSRAPHRKNNAVRETTTTTSERWSWSWGAQPLDMWRGFRSISSGKGNAWGRRGREGGLFASSRVESSSCVAQADVAALHLADCTSTSSTVLYLQFSTCDAMRFDAIRLDSPATEFANVGNTEQWVHKLQVILAAWNVYNFHWNYSCQRRNVLVNSFGWATNRTSNTRMPTTPLCHERITFK